MNLTELKNKVDDTIDKLNKSGIFPKENNIYDYKKNLNFYNLNDPVEIFLKNFAKDIISFSNGIGGIILLGILENKGAGKFEDVGLDEENINLLNKIDLNDISQKFQKICKTDIAIDLQMFQFGTRKFFYLLIEKSNQVIIPINDFKDYNIKKGEILYRKSGKNVTANDTPDSFNQFLQIKSNEKNKEFMEIWSKLLPEMVDINPREILLINPKENKVYGYNDKDNILSSSDIEIDQTQDGVFNVILQAISAGEIGKISDTEGKPLYKIVGEIKANAPREHISITTLHNEVLKIAIYNFSNIQLKQILKYLGWVNDENFSVQNPKNDPVNPKYIHFIWLENFDKIKNVHKVVVSESAIQEVLEIVNNLNLHKGIFGRELALITTKKKTSQVGSITN
ncbi:RNA-binding domain-containing protein [Pedobacter agri]|uniref:RNA-binding domain-containing protein n=1 Tax=Pedobacter agri TaxID=454586 RepID=UPI00292EFA9E|nr:RNA-binding domain-containing protein [Pedobacter agri]